MMMLCTCLIVNDVNVFVLDGVNVLLWMTYEFFFGCG